MKRIFCWISIVFLVFARVLASPKIILSGVVRSDAVINTRQVLSVAGGNVGTSWPLQRVPGEYRGLFVPDLLARPNADFGTIKPSLSAAVTGLDMGKALVDVYANLNFIGFDFADGGGLLTNCFLQATLGQQSFAMGRLPHPLLITYCAPSTISVDLGSPITPFALCPQFRYRYGYNSFFFNANFFTQYLISNAGPLPVPFSFSNTYIRNATTPSIFSSLEYDDSKFLGGVACVVQRLRPRLFTSPTDLEPQGLLPSVVALAEHITTWAGCLYGSYKNEKIYVTAQAIYGENGTAWSNLGGYGVSFINPINNLKKYTPIYFQSCWLDCTFVWRNYWIQPGFYVGVTTNLGSKEKLVRNNQGNLEVYSIDLYQEYLSDLFNVPATPLMQLVRFSPRIWFYLSDSIVCGVEGTLLKVSYAEVDDYFKPISNQRIGSLQAKTSFQYLY